MSKNWHNEFMGGFSKQMSWGKLEANALYFATGVRAYSFAQLLKGHVLPAPYRT